MNTYQLLINNEWIGPDSGQYFDALDPFSGEVWAKVPRGDARDVDKAAKAASAAMQGPWGQMSATDRGRLLYKLGALIEENAQSLAKLESRDNGKLLSEVLGQVRYSAKYFCYYGGLADKIQGAVIPIDNVSILCPR